MKNKLNNYVLVGFIFCFVILLTGCGVTQFEDSLGNTVFFPIAKGLFGEGGSLDWLVYPMAWLMNFIAVNIVQHNYALTILLATVLIRTLAWPVYGKTNDMSLKMQLLGPEQRKIEQKYEGKVDKESQQRKSMETMQLYKKYKVSFAGCLMPIIQMPIFLAFYETLRRIPYSTQQYLNSLGSSASFQNTKGTLTLEVTELMYDFGSLKTNILGIDLMQGATEGWQKWGIYILAALVGITQIGTQLISQHRAKKQKEKMEGDVPQYRRKGPSDQQKQTDMMMKIMLYAMPVMMIIFIIQSTAALGWYWLVGNIYTGAQSIISGSNSAKKMEKLRNKYNKNYI